MWRILSIPHVAIPVITMVGILIYHWVNLAE